MWWPRRTAAHCYYGVVVFCRCEGELCRPPCENGGRCLANEKGDWRCYCWPDFSGERCEVNHCTDYCLNGGTCGGSPLGESTSANATLHFAVCVCPPHGAWFLCLYIVYISFVLLSSLQSKHPASVSWGFMCRLLYSENLLLSRTGLFNSERLDPEIPPHLSSFKLLRSSSLQFTFYTLHLPVEQFFSSVHWCDCRMSLKYLPSPTSRSSLCFPGFQFYPTI